MRNLQLHGKSGNSSYLVLPLDASIVTFTCTGGRAPAEHDLELKKGSGFI